MGMNSRILTLAIFLAVIASVFTSGTAYAIGTPGSCNFSATSTATTNASSNNTIVLNQTFNCGAPLVLPTVGGNYSTGQPAIIVMTDNLTIDCAGFSIIGNASTFGIYNPWGFRNLTIKNCFITNFTTYGIAISNISTQAAGNSSITNTTITNFTQGGILLNNTNSTLISNLTIMADGNSATPASMDVNISGSSFNTLVNGSYFNHKGAGIVLTGASTGNSITNITINSSAQTLMFANAILIAGAGSTNNIISNVTAVAANTSAIAFDVIIGGGNNSIFNSLAISNSAPGINISSPNNSVMNSTGVSTWGDGILLQGTAADNNTIWNSTGTSSVGNGIQLLGGAWNNTLGNVTGASTGGAGILLNVVNMTWVMQGVGISSTGSGINFTGVSTNNTVGSSTRANSTTGMGLSLGAAENNTIANSTFISVGLRGIMMASSNANFFRGVTAGSTSGIGMYLLLSNNNTFTGGWITSSTNDGVNITASGNNTLGASYVTITGAGGAGITLSDAASQFNKITSTHVRDNMGGSGIAFIRDAANNTVNDVRVNNSVVGLNFTSSNNNTINASWISNSSVAEIKSINVNTGANNSFFNTTFEREQNVTQVKFISFNTNSSLNSSNMRMARGFFAFDPAQSPEFNNSVTTTITMNLSGIYGASAAPTIYYKQTYVADRANVLSPPQTECPSTQCQNETWLSGISVVYWNMTFLNSSFAPDAAPSETKGGGGGAPQPCSPPYCLGPKECTFDGDCAAGKMCSSSNTCVDKPVAPECTVSADCGSGKICTAAGTCAPAPVTPPAQPPAQPPAAGQPAQPPPTPEKKGEANAALNAAKDAITKAANAGKDTAPAYAKLAEAQAAFNAGDYNKAIQLSAEAKRLAESAPAAPAAPTPTVPTAQPAAPAAPARPAGFGWLIWVVLAVVVLAVVYYFFGRAKYDRT